MHLFKKWSKYAFAYASMQMHNYPKPSHYNIKILRPKVMKNLTNLCKKYIEKRTNPQAPQKYTCALKYFQ